MPFVHTFLLLLLLFLPSTGLSLYVVVVVVDDDDISLQSKPSTTNRISSRNGSKPNRTNRVTLGRIDIQAKMKCSARDGGSTPVAQNDDDPGTWCSSEAFSFSRKVVVWAAPELLGDASFSPTFPRVGKDDMPDAFDDDDAFGRDILQTKKTSSFESSSSPPPPPPPLEGRPFVSLSLQNRSSRWSRVREKNSRLM